MKQFLDFTGLSYFLDKLKTIFVGNITTDNAAENAASGTITFTKENSDGEIVETTVAVKNVVTTDTTQTISGDKTFEGAVIVPTPTENGHATTKAYVDEVLSQADAMTYKGTIGASGTGDIQTLPLTTSGSGRSRTPVTGDTYKVVTAGTYTIKAAGADPQEEPAKTQEARIGDLFIAKVINPSGSGTKDVEWSYIPSGDETETFVAITDGDTSQSHPEVNINTTPASGNVYFGEAAAKQVATVFSGTYNTDAANDGELTTVGAVAEYALKDITNASGDSSLTIGTKTSGEQTLAVKIKSDSGISSDANGIYAVADTNNGISIDANGIGVIVNTNSGLSMDATNGVTLTTPGNGIEVDSTSHNIKAVGNGVKGIEITGSGISAKLNDTNGLKFDSNGKISLDLGNGLAETASDNKLEVKIDSNNANGLSTSSNGVALALATPSTNNVGGTAGAMSAQDKEKLDNLGTNYADKLDVETGSTTGTVDLKLKNSSAGTLDTVTITSANKAISVAASGTAGTSAATTLTVTANVDTTTGLQVDSTNGIQINNGNGTQFNGTSGAIEVKAYDGITVDANGVSADIDTTDGLEFTGNTAGSKKIGVKANSAKGIESTSNGVGIVVLTDSGLSFDNTTGGQENGALYIETIPVTGENSIESLFA